MKRKQYRIAFDMDGMTTIGKVRFHCRRVKYNGYEKFRLSANPPQEKRIDREFESEEQARSFFIDGKPTTIQLVNPIAKQ